jgi:transcriptional regulator with XRE-family HTH domain
MDYTYDKEVGQKIRACRIARNMTQDQLAAKLQIRGYDLTRLTIAKIESGKRHIYLYEFKAITEVLKASFEDFLV